MKRIKVAIPGNARPDVGGQQTKEITVPLYYYDGKVIHACESGVIVPGVRLVSTKRAKRRVVSRFRRKVVG